MTGAETRRHRLGARACRASRPLSVLFLVRRRLRLRPLPISSSVSSSLAV